jgi:hypothetical protein
MTDRMPMSAPQWAEHQRQQYEDFLAQLRDEAAARNRTAAPATPDLESGPELEPTLF